MSTYSLADEGIVVRCFVCRIELWQSSMETGKFCDNIRVIKNGLVSGVDSMFKTSDSAFKHITDWLNPLRKSVEFDIFFLRPPSGVRFACNHDNVEVLVPWKWDRFLYFGPLRKRSRSLSFRTDLYVCTNSNRAHIGCLRYLVQTSEGQRRTEFDMVGLLSSETPSDRLSVWHILFIKRTTPRFVIGSFKVQDHMLKHCKLWQTRYSWTISARPGKLVCYLWQRTTPMIFKVPSDGQTGHTRQFGPELRTTW